MEVPKYVTQGLLAAFQVPANGHIAQEDRGFPVWDERVNWWLANNLGIHADSPRLPLGDTGLVVFFDWTIQVWRVR
jgi:hypothetical protein